MWRALAVTHSASDRWYTVAFCCEPYGIKHVSVLDKLRMRQRRLIQNFSSTLKTMLSHDSSSTITSSRHVAQNHHTSSRMPSDSAVANIPCPTQETSSSHRLHALNGFHLHFARGSHIQLARGQIKNIEDLDTTDFIESAHLCPEVTLEQSTVVRLEQNQSTGLFLVSFSVGKNTAEVTISATPEHPFFVYGHGWSSCAPSLTMARYSLNCMQLRVGDVCVSLARSRH